MRDVEGGRGRGFDHNVGRKGAEKVGKRAGGGRGREQNLVVPEKFFFVTKLISKKEITLTDMAGVRGFISMTIAYYQHSQV